METILRRGLLFSLFLTLASPFISCDSGGSNSSPNWAGNWEITSIDGEQPVNPLYFDLNQDRLKTIEVFSDGCRIKTAGIVERNGGTIQFDSPSEIWRGQFEVSDEELEVTVLSVTGEFPELSQGDTFLGQRIEGDPQDVENCSD